MIKFGAVVGIIGFAVAIYRLDLLGSSSSSKICKADAKEKWTYRGDNGPEHWKDRYKMCASGKEQSPIAINSKQLVNDKNLPKLQMVNYDKPVTKANILNNGYTVQITPNDGVARTIDVNGITYTLAQLHFHWGETSKKGSEHTIDGKQYSMELHFVHLNKDKLAVVAVMFQEQSKMNQELQTITKAFPKVMYKSMKSDLKSNDSSGLFSISANSILNLEKLLPVNPSSYFRYQGSLTFPNCAEGVTWSVLTKSLPVGTKQMKEFRKLYSATKKDASNECRISDNFRPVQPTNQRKVYKSQ